MPLLVRRTYPTLGVGSFVKKNQGFLARQVGVAKGCCQTVFKFKILPNTFGWGITGPSTACDPTVSFHKPYMEGLLPKNVVGISCFVLKAFPKPLFSSDGILSKNPSGNTHPFKKLGQQDADRHVVADTIRSHGFFWHAFEHTQCLAPMGNPHQPRHGHVVGHHLAGMGGWIF